MAMFGTMRSSYTAARIADRPKRTRRPLLLIAAQGIGRAAGHVTVSWAALRTLLLTLTALTLIDVAAWQWHTWTGLVVTGLSLLVVEALTGPPSGGDG